MAFNQIQLVLPQATEASVQLAHTWHQPLLTPLGTLQALTAGGSAQRYSEAFGCDRQAILFRC